MYRIFNGIRKMTASCLVLGLLTLSSSFVMDPQMGSLHSPLTGSEAANITISISAERDE